MATTTNYGWTTPDDTALVKDGAAAIRTLGSSIDTSLNTALGTKKAGLVLLNTTSFSAVASQSINDVFSASYENYRINLDFIGSTNNGVSMRLRVGGADSSSTDYKRQYIYATNTLLSAGRGTTNTSWPLAGNNGTDRSLNTIDVFGAFLSRVTIASCFSGNNLSGTPENVIEGFGHNLATSYTGFTLIASAGTITGKVSVYGYNS